MEAVQFDLLRLGHLSDRVKKDLKAGACPPTLLLEKNDKRKGKHHGTKYTV